jgi:hypothetical protein
MEQPAFPILLVCIGYASKAAKSERLAHISSREWQAVVELARQQDVTPLIYCHLKRPGIALPRDLTEELEQAFLMNAARNIRLYHD